MTKVSVLAALLSVSFAGAAFAAETKSEGESALKIEDAAGKKNKVEGDIDQEITNRKLRAETGSKSRVSVSLTANYSGGSMEKPMDKNRPNPVRDPIPPKTSLGGDIGLRVRLDKGNSLTFGTGYSLQRPFHEAERGDISSPFVKFTNAAKLGVIQNVAEAQVTVATNSDDLEIGTLGSVSADNTMIYDFGGSKSSLGVNFGGFYTHYTKRDERVSVKGAPANIPAVAFQQDYGVAIYPFYEYQISDKVNFRTVFRPWIFNHDRDADGFTFEKRPWTQSVGIGIAATRDIYLYPNFQFDWEKWRRDDFNFARKTTRESSTVGFSATMNVF
jgi:hypothetical protein